MRRSWFLPERPDVLGMLRHQAAVTCEGMGALVAWANAEPDAAQRVWERLAATHPRFADSLVKSGAVF